MLAIVSISQTSHGESVQLLGAGDSEFEARAAAYARVHHGHNDFDQEYRGGTLVEVTERLKSLMYRGDDWHNDYDQEGNLVGGEASNAHFDLMRALGRLCVRRGKLDYRDPELTQ